MRYMALAALVMSGFLSAAEVKDPAAAMGADQKAALASFQAFLDGLGKRDKAAMMAQLLPGGSAVLMRKGKPVQMTLEALAERLSQPGTESHEERIDGRWVIAAIEDNARTECGAH